MPVRRGRRRKSPPGPSDPAFPVGVHEKGEHFPPVGPIPTHRAVPKRRHRETSVGAQVHPPGDTRHRNIPELRARTVVEAEGPVGAEQETLAIGRKG